jgi:hypothetical protein
MSADIDLPLLYDPIAKEVKGKLYWADLQRDWLATFVQTVISYLGSSGINLPQLTTAQRNALVSPQNGQLIYNTTLDTAQYFQVSSGTWKSFP